MNQLPQLKRLCAAGIVLVFLLLLLTGCSDNTFGFEIFDNFNEEFYTGEINVKMPEATGEIVHEANGALLDVSNSAEGYFFASCSGIDSLIKIQIVAPGGGVYSFRLPNDGTAEVFPFSEGSGAYKIMIGEQIEGTTFAVVYATEITVELVSETVAFTYPNQTVNYTPTDRAVNLSFSLTQDCATDSEKIQLLFRYVGTKITYDDDLAARVLAGQVDSAYTPVSDNTLANGKGICYDYSALLATMLRAQNIPAKLVKGYVSPENVYHAWNFVWDGEQWLVLDSTMYHDQRGAENYFDDLYF